MRVLLDTCIIIDALQDRAPFSEDAQSVFLFCANRRFDGFLTAKSITDVYYLTHRHTHNEQQTREIMKKLCSLFGLLDTTGPDVRRAFSSALSDYEDAVMVETALRSGIDCIVTRNIKDYEKSVVPVYTPTHFLSLFNT